MGRIGGCTGWLVSEDVFIQAGHCGTPSSSTRIHFVYGTGSAAPEDQYAVDVASYDGVNGGVGNDWGAGRLLPNSVTNKLPGVAQSEKCGSSGCGWFNLGPFPTTTSGNNIRITGYGTAAVDGQSQKTHVGALTTIGPDHIRYVPDTTGGNSGSPVVHEEEGYAIGVHTHGGCSATGGSNIGTRIDRPEFAAYVDSLMGAPTTSPPTNAPTTPSPTNLPTNPPPCNNILDKSFCQSTNGCEWSNGKNSGCSDASVSPPPSCDSCSLIPDNKGCGNCGNCSWSGKNKVCVAV